MNFLGCANCHQRDFVLISDRTIMNEDEEEIVTYLRESRHITSLHGHIPLNVSVWRQNDLLFLRYVQELWSCHSQTWIHLHCGGWLSGEPCSQYLKRLFHIIEQVSSHAIWEGKKIFLKIRKWYNVMQMAWKQLILCENWMEIIKLSWFTAQENSVW